jgi:hypothetical protein
MSKVFKRVLYSFTHLPFYYYPGTARVKKSTARRSE